MSCSNKRRKRERGNAVLEFAIGWSVLWAIFGGVYQYGYSFYVYNRLMTAVSNAAQLGSKIGYDTGNSSDFTGKLQNMVLYADETAPSSPSPIVSGLTASNVSVAVSTDAQGMPRDVTVSIVNYKIDGFFGSITLNNKPRATVLYFGQITCSTC
ncbi:MAG: pilus assembly protein [Acidobacteriia bacterium]|nr:pilus assembly protein [Terriglobia bacterium]